MKESHDVFALLPAWRDDVVGVKAFTYLPGNAAKDRDILYSNILLFDRESGAPLALVDGTSVTFWRTAAVAALAADYLARRDAARLLVCGTATGAVHGAGPRRRQADPRDRDLGTESGEGRARRRGRCAAAARISTSR